MKFCCCLVLSAILLLDGATGAVIRKPPAFAKPTYSDSYLPASMQVIFHVVEQLKRLEIDEVEQNLLLTPSTSPHPPGQRQPDPTAHSRESESDGSETSTVSEEEKYYEPPERYQEAALILVKPPGDGNRDKSNGGVGIGVTPEANQEESEVVYALPEGNYETKEPNDEIAEAGSEGKPTICKEKKLLGNVESVVKEIYSIIEESSSSSSSSSSEKDVNQESTPNISPVLADCIEGKNSPIHSDDQENEDEETKGNDKERSEEQNEEERFTLLGERVDQVPSPSLAAFVRAGNTTKNPSLQQLGELYDALSRDARRQGYSKFAGYSDEVLKTLEESAGGSAGDQLKLLLDKTVSNKELTRYDAMEKSGQVLGFLNDGGSKLSTDLRRIYPLRYLH